MANWSFDLPRLTDRDVVKIPIFCREETSKMGEEGFGNEVKDMESVMNFKRSGEGVFAVASTTYSLKVLVEFLTSPTVKIPVRALDIGTITPVEIRKACQQLSTILAFEVDVTPEASQLAKRLEVKVICGSVLETLCQQFKEHIEELGVETKTDDEEAIFPCVLSILPNLVFIKEDPIVLGVLVVEGFIKVGTPVSNLRSGGGCLNIGRIAWIEKDQQPVKVARLGEMVIIKIVASNPEEQGQGRIFGSHFDITDDLLVSRISRGSINALKASYKDELSMRDWQLVSDLKCVLNIK